MTHLLACLYRLKLSIEDMMEELNRLTFVVTCTPHNHVRLPGSRGKDERIKHEKKNDNVY